MKTRFQKNERYSIWIFHKTTHTKSIKNNLFDAIAHMQNYIHQSKIAHPTKQQPLLSHEHFQCSNWNGKSNSFLVNDLPFLLHHIHLQHMHVHKLTCMYACMMHIECVFIASAEIIQCCLCFDFFGSKKCSHCGHNKSAISKHIQWKLTRIRSKVVAQTDWLRGGEWVSDWFCLNVHCAYTIPVVIFFIVQLNCNQ